ncbi:hypothetical protein HDV00_005031 [Rhizophlyctis rosea]|nr:hypothetical protein HDV00_005031 [Rhizophlyctis rosea]
MTKHYETRYNEMEKQYSNLTNALHHKFSTWKDGNLRLETIDCHNLTLNSAERESIRLLIQRDYEQAGWEFAPRSQTNLNPGWFEKKYTYRSGTYWAFEIKLKAPGGYVTANAKFREVHGLPTA